MICMNNLIKKANIYSIKKTASKFESVRITRSEDSASYIRQFFTGDIGIFESFFLMLLNRNNDVIGYVKISQGGINGTIVDPILVAKYAIDSLSKNVILAHNHPSGNLQPSPDDRQITEKIKDGLKLFDVKVLDHIILTEESYLSFSDEGYL